MTASAMSLRTRLTVGLLGLVAVVIVALSVSMFVALKAFMLDRVDAELVTAPPGLAQRLCTGRPGTAPRPPLPFQVARIDAAGAPDPACAGSPYPLRLSGPDLDRLLATPRRPVDLRASDGPVRAVGRPEDGGLDVLALPLNDLRATLERLLALEVGIGALALILAGILGVLGMNRGLRPLSQVTATARTIAAEVSAGSGGLQRRVPAGAAQTEVGQLAEAFNTMLTAVEIEVAGRQRSEQRMRQFLADAGHELRTPLTSVRGYAELITLWERRPGVRREARSVDALRRITEEGARMSRLVHDLLVLARSDQGAPRRNERVALEELAVDAVADLRAAHPGRGVTLAADPGCLVEGDPDQLRQVLANLLTTAAVHTAGPIRIRIGRDAHRVRAVVADDGPGLSPSQAAHVFDRFWRADRGRTRDRGGSGLGLAIVDTLVGAHGGDIDFDTAPGTGTTVTVLFPAASESPAAG